MWEERYQTDEYVFGTAPAAFLKAHDAYLQGGQTALSVADGEGRNSVFMAEKGLAVTALEFAPSAIAKAEKLSAARGVSVDFRQTDVLSYEWPDQYDLVVGIFIQFMGPEPRRQLFEGMKRAVTPGGIIMLHGYTPKQLEFKTGGPPSAENMYTPELLAALFEGWELIENRAYEATIHEGRGHSGPSALIDFIARKPS